MGLAFGIKIDRFGRGIWDDINVEVTLDERFDLSGDFVTWRGVWVLLRSGGGVDIVFEVIRR